jgi:NADH:ubiquinone oxidoreductase subunit 5 (subunit L)/multisubunit Na+/H+ antiporter MnhA subunit/multisubunit Na+/H+ antiporter MnhB subunit
VLDEGALVRSIPWIPSLGLAFSIRLDGLSALFALLVSGIGALIMIYAGSYAKRDPGAWRLFLYLQIFFVSMIGLVVAGNLFLLFIFWEGTSVASYLLIGYAAKNEKARSAAFKSLLVTGGGGIALLAAFLLIESATGSADLAEILASGNRLRESSLYIPILILAALAAFTKSAQFPFHIWLPDGMTAPTPASAYLHSATMVKAGIYLLARLNPVLGLTESWFWVLTATGTLTMLFGAYLGLSQRDLKRLLAYSTISQLGVLTMLIGQDTAIAFKAVVIAVLAHSLYKSALFMTAGIVDHETGTRDLDRLGGLRRAMPGTAAAAVLGGLSMAGLPPMFGFLAKETLISTATHPTLPPFINLILAGTIVAAGALILAQAGVLVLGTFAGPRREGLEARDPPAPMLVAALVPAAASLLFALVPLPGIASLLAAAAGAAFGSPVKVSLALWSGVGIPLALSVVAVSLGLVLLRFESRVRNAQKQLEVGRIIDRLYDGLLAGVDALSRRAVRLQHGRLRLYLSVMFLAVVILFVLFGRPVPPRLAPASVPLDLWAALRVFALAIVVASSAATIVLRRDLHAILALGASGLNVAVLFLLEPAPDVALAMIVVDILTVVILVLALTKLPAAIRARADALDFRESKRQKILDAILASGVGAAAALVAWTALATRPRPSEVSQFYAERSKALAGARDIVGAIVIDFRGFDTLIEIAVFSLAGIGAFSLLCRGALKRDARAADRGSRSPLLRSFAFVILPLCMVLAAVFVMYGHDRPGDGFVGGVIVALAVVFWYAVFGAERSRRTLRWVRPLPLAVSGLALALVQASISYFVNGSFYTPVDFGRRLGLPLPDGFALSTSFLMEVAIFLAVLGGASLVIDSTGHPDDSESCESSGEGR